MVIRAHHITVLFTGAGPDAPTANDNGFGDDDANFPDVAITAEDTAAGFDDHLFPVADSDTGAGTDAGSLSYTDSDTGAGVETGYLIVVPTADSGTATVELGSVSGITYTDEDTGTGEECCLLAPQTIVANGILVRKWGGSVDFKWTVTANARWSARIVNGQGEPIDHGNSCC